MARVTMAVLGSKGDLFPFLAIGRALKIREHEVVVAGSRGIAPFVEKAGLRFFPFRPNFWTEGGESRTAEIVEKKGGAERMFSFLFSREALVSGFVDLEPLALQTDIWVIHPLAMAAALVARKQNMPWVSAMLAPMPLFSAYDFPVLPHSSWLSAFCRLHPLLGWLGRAWLRQRTARLVKEVCEVQKELNLPPLHPFFEGRYSPHLILALFSRFFCPPRPDWPKSATITGFPFWDEEALGLSEELVRFLDEGDPPVVFTLGSTAVEAPGDFYRESLEAASRLGLRAVLLTGKKKVLVPQAMQGRAIALSYAPYASLFPRVRAVVHHGGIGTIAQCLRAQKPMVIVPYAFDQIDNARHAQRIGVAEVVKKTRLSQKTLALALAGVLDKKHAAQAQALGARVSEENGAVAAALAVEKVIVGQKDASVPLAAEAAAWR